MSASVAAGTTRDIESESTCNIGIGISLNNTNTMDNNTINMNINTAAAAAAAGAPYCEETENSFGEALQAFSIQNLEKGRENGKKGADAIIVDVRDNQTYSLPSSTGSGSRSIRSISIISNSIMIGSGNLLANSNSNDCSNDPSLDLKISSSAASRNETDTVIVDVTDNDIQDEIESENELQNTAKKTASFSKFIVSLVFTFFCI